MMGIGEHECLTSMPIMDMLESLGIPMLDGLLPMPLNEPSEQAQMEVAQELLGDLPVGITHFVLLPSVDTAALRVIAPDRQSRVANYNAFMSGELKKFLESEDTKPIGYRDVRNAMRSS